MGGKVAELIAEAPDLELAGGIEKNEHPSAGKELSICEQKIGVARGFENHVPPAELLVDFTVPEATPAILEFCTGRGMAFITGTTGHSRENIAAMREASKKIPLLFSPNMSVGITLLARVLPGIATSLGEDCDVEIVRCGILQATVKRTTVEVDMGRPRGLKQNVAIVTRSGHVVGDAVDTGVSHFVTRPRRWRNLDVSALGREIRLHKAFRPHGANVDFVRAGPDGSVLLRTYERGVEAETLACGTGAVAAAVCLAVRGQVSSPVSVHTHGGDTLIVRFAEESHPLSRSRLEGPAQVIYEGDIPLSVLKRIAKRPRFND